MSYGIFSKYVNLLPISCQSCVFLNTTSVIISLENALTPSIEKLFNESVSSLVEKYASTFPGLFCRVFKVADFGTLNLVIDPDEMDDLMS